MAEKTNDRKINEVFWSNLDMASSDEEDAFVPGVSAPGNRRPSRVKGRKTREVKASIPLKQPFIENMKYSLLENERTSVASNQDTLSSKQPGGEKRMRKPQPPVESRRHQVVGTKKKPIVQPRSYPGVDRPTSSYRDDTLSTSLESFAERSLRQLQQASLKDLRPEDKQRVANLIKELARVGEEKEKAVKELHGERVHYEKQLLTLVDQQENILKEREDVQDKLFQCQQLLTEYQSQLLNKQDRIHSSIADMQEAMDENKMADQCKPVKVMEAYPPCLNTSLTEERCDSPELNCLPATIPAQSSETNQSERKSRSRESAPRPGSSSHKEERRNRLSNEHGENDSVAELLIETKDPIKRPFTSLIDKEIARERSLSCGSRGSIHSCSRSISPSDGRPRFSYPQKVTGYGPLQEPIASSTHKSMEIRAQISNNYDPDSPRSSLRGSSVRGQSPANSDRQRSKVAFYEEAERDENIKMHSPNLKHSGMFKDSDYGDYYKKLSQSGRKKELLKQRQALLDEQERLRQVLEKQERQLLERKAEYDKKQELQRQRMEFYKEGGKFPAFKLDFDADSERGAGFDTQRGGFNREAEIVDMATDGMMNIDAEDGRYTPQENIEIDDEVQIRSRVSAGTSPLASPRVTKVSMATSPVRSQDSAESDIPRLIDVATSISYRSPLGDASNRQGNLPLCANRQRHSPGIKQGPSQTHRLADRLGVNHVYSQSPLVEHPPSPAAKTPGEKTLNVLEIVNSMEESPAHHNGSYGDENVPNFTPNKYLTQTKGDHSSPYRQYTSPSQPRSRHGKLLDDQEESLEENKILEDIFFL